jgi:hypothetical protein
MSQKQLTSFQMAEEVVQMQKITGKSENRRQFIGGSDARIIMSGDEAALIRLWKEKRGEAEPEDFSDNLIVQLGITTEALNRSWYERNRTRAISDVQRWVQYPVHRFLAATLDGFVSELDAEMRSREPIGAILLSSPTRQRSSLIQWKALIATTRYLCRRFCKRSRIPGSSSGEPTNWIPPATNAASISDSVCVRPGGSPSTDSMRIIVRALTPDLSANSSIDQFNAALPARICAPTIIDRLSTMS